MIPCESKISKYSYRCDVEQAVMFGFSPTGENGYALWGWKTVGEFCTTGEFPPSELFPLVTFCDVDLRRLGKRLHACDWCLVLGACL